MSDQNDNEADSHSNPHVRDATAAAIALGAVRPSDSIAIVGSQNFKLLLELCRRGFRHVSCLAAAGGPRAGNDDLDVLLIPCLESSGMLAEILRRFARDVRPGGKVIIGLWTGRGRLLRGVLAENGFTAARSVGEIVCVATRIGNDAINARAA
jgi:hypothetical protein